ncbi:MAG: cytochrome c biogenesis protein ResB [Bdellovibrionia bacterium]
MKKKIIKPLASLKLAVFIIVALAILTAIGTFVEARYDAYAAKKLVYNTWWMYSILGLLAINLTAVMVDRWPWKKRHAAFVCAHIGIIIILFGSILTQQFGLDGTMRIGIGESNGLVQVPETDIVVYTSFDGDRYSKVLEQEVDFFLKPPSVENPFVIPTVDKKMQIVDYKKYVIPAKKIEPATSGSWGAGIRLQVQSSVFNVVEWIVQRKKNLRETLNFGPAQAHIGPAPAEGNGANEFYIEPLESGDLRYTVFHKDQKKPYRTGVIKEGGSFDTGWMDATVRILRYYPQAQENWDIQEVPKPTPLSTAAVKVVYDGKEHWLLMNDMVKFFSDNAVYLVTYANRRIDLGFKVDLKKFEITRYQGTMRAMAYESVVSVPEISEAKISMNEPLKYKGLTFYQASFQEENGAPIASVLSVNNDPGRFWKYLGSLIMSIGIVLLFYFKNLDFRLKKQQGQLK